jgi:putative DNA primase/helicase
LVLEAEDDLARVVTPRLLAAGADLKRVSIGRVIDVSASIDALEAERRRRPDLRLVVLSPVRKFIGEAELRGNVATREALDPLLSWAEQHEIAVLGVIHPPKTKLEAFSGSTAFLEIARAAFSILPDKKDKGLRTLVSAKANLGPDQVSMAYRIGAATVQGIETSRVVWSSPC